MLSMLLFLVALPLARVAAQEACGQGGTGDPCHMGKFELVSLLQSPREVHVSAASRSFELEKEKDILPAPIELKSPEGMADVQLKSQEVDCIQSRTADLVCANFPRPRIGHCLHGQARTLAHPLVYRTVRFHVVEALGGDLVSFASVKLTGPGKDHWYPRGQDENAVKAALAYIGIGPGQMRLIREGEAGFSPVIPNCGHYAGNETKDTLSSLAAQLANRAQCFDLMESYEKSSGKRFQHVLTHRADITWPAPMMPHCLLGAKLQLFLQTSDFVQLMPRDIAEIVLKDMSQAFTSCSQLFNSTDYVELWELRYFKGRNLWPVPNQHALPCYPLRDITEDYQRNFSIWQLNRSKDDWASIIAPDMGDTNGMLHVTALNTCNRL